MIYLLLVLVANACIGVAVFHVLWRDKERFCECVAAFIACMFLGIILGLIRGSIELCRWVDNKRGLPNKYRWDSLE